MSLGVSVSNPDPRIVQNMPRLFTFLNFFKPVTSLVLCTSFGKISSPILVCFQNIFVYFLPLARIFTIFISLYFWLCLNLKNIY
uniref:Uncharacterized protein n=1 Tax=Meloidogyne incognita TaxID=6306 RepID=A0A914MHG2_MELIC